MKKFLFALLLFSITSISNGQVNGCTDPKANNYNIYATVNDGSCTYNGANVTPLTSKLLSSLLPESSGLIHWNNSIWTHNDDTDTKLYEVDTATAAVKQSYTLPSVINKDWEEISQDSNFVYVGDFGNNSSGNRTDLHILRIQKSSILANTPVIDTIWFSYSDQTDFTATAANQTDFDCEAFIVSADSIYLFTKQWLNNKSRIYALPKLPGTYSAQLRGTLNIQGLATGITYLESKRLIVICGYSALLQPFFYFLYDFNGHDFLSGNKRKVDVNLPFHQVEGVATENGLKYYASNENFSKGIINTPQKLHTFDLSNFFGIYLHEIVLSNPIPEKKSEVGIFPNPTGEFITIQCTSDRVNTSCTILDVTGKKFMEATLSARSTTLNIKSLPAGMYFVHLDGTTSNFSFLKN